MASYQIIAWNDVPAMVEARDDSETVTRQLSERGETVYRLGDLAPGDGPARVEIDGAGA